jgi:hypothetical protein
MHNYELAKKLCLRKISVLNAKLNLAYVRKRTTCPETYSMSEIGQQLGIIIIIPTMATFYF